MTIFALTVELTALDAESAAKHLRSLAELVESGPDATGWSTSDIEGSTMALPVAQPQEDPNQVLMALS